MKTPKEKALELVEEMAIHHWTDVCNYEGAKQCALLAVNEILKVASFYNDSQAEVIYFKQVKQEIEKL
jgi:hypothetical protein